MLRSSLTPIQIDGKSVKRLCRRFRHLSRGCLAETGKRDRSLDAIGSDEKRLLRNVTTPLQRFRKPNASTTCSKRRAETNPDLPAVRCGDQQLTYRELNVRANKIAHRLRELGVGRDSCVGIYLDRSVDLIAGLLGIQKAGGAYVPLNLDHPSERIAYQIKQANSKALVTARSLIKDLDWFSGEIVTVEDMAADGSQPSAIRNISTLWKDLAYVIYTSGSTGVPKGVGNTHRALVNYTQFMCRRLGLQIPPAKSDFNSGLFPA